MTPAPAWDRVGSLVATEERLAGREHLLGSLADLILWAEEVDGCWEYTGCLRALLRAHHDGHEAVVLAYVKHGAFPEPLRATAHVHHAIRDTSACPQDAEDGTDSRMSVVQWTLRPDQAAYETLLRLLFEEPAPVDGYDLDRQRGSAWRA